MVSEFATKGKDMSYHQEGENDGNDDEKEAEETTREHPSKRPESSALAIINPPHG